MNDPIEPLCDHHPSDIRANAHEVRNRIKTSCLKPVIPYAMGRSAIRSGNHFRAVVSGVNQINIERKIMNAKQHIIDELAEIFNRWQILLASLSEEQLNAPLVPSSWTVKDVVAHLWSWQQASVARMEAGLQDEEPNYPNWWIQRGPDPDEDVDGTNALIYSLSKDKPWQVVFVDWKTQFMHYLKLTQQIPEVDFLQPERYTWMGKYAIADSSKGALDHHKEHFDTLLAWLKEHT